MRQTVARAAGVTCALLLAGCVPATEAQKEELAFAVTGAEEHF